MSIDINIRKKQTLAILSLIELTINFKSAVNKRMANGTGDFTPLCKATWYARNQLDSIHVKVDDLSYYAKKRENKEIAWLLIEKVNKIELSKCFLNKGFGKHFQTLAEGSHDESMKAIKSMFKACKVFTEVLKDSLGLEKNDHYMDFLNTAHTTFVVSYRVCNDCFFSKPSLTQKAGIIYKSLSD